MVEAFWRSLEMLRTIMAGVIMLLFVYMIEAVFAQVIGRYVFNFSIAAADETSTFALIWMVLLAAGLAMRRGSMSGIDILADNARRASGASDPRFGAARLVVFVDSLRWRSRPRRGRPIPRLRRL